MPWRLAWFAKGHPRHRASPHMWLAQVSVSGLIVGLLGSLAVLSVGLSALYLVTEDPSRPAAYRGDNRRFAWLVVSSLRALLGVDDFPRQTDNSYHEVLATASALVGALVPALVLGVVLIKLFAMRAFQWRRRFNVCLAAELEGDLVGGSLDGRHGYLAVRWYKRLSNLSVVDLRADAYVRARAISTVDGSTMYRFQRLRVLNLEGNEADSCVWPETFSGMPFTLWIPLRAPVMDGRITSIQGRELNQDDDRQLVVRLSGRVAGLMTELSDEHRYHLDRDVQFGRFVPVEPDLNTPEEGWRGWKRFDKPITHGLFLYGEGCHPDALPDLAHRWPRRPPAARVRLDGFIRCWHACTDNTDPDRRASYLEDGRAVDATVLFLALRRLPGKTTTGLLVPVDAERLAELDTQEGGYIRENVTDVVRPVDSAGNLPDVVWTYVAGAGQEERVRKAYAAGTARLSHDYLRRLTEALSAHDGLLDELTREAQPPNVPTVRLTRLPHPSEVAQER